MFGGAWRCKLLIESRIRASAATFAQTDDTEHDRDKTGLSGLSTCGTFTCGPDVIEPRAMVDPGRNRRRGQHRQRIGLSGGGQPEDRGGQPAGDYGVGRDDFGR